MSTHQNQHFYEMRRQFKAAHLDPAVELMQAATAAVEEAERRAKQAETHLEVMTPVWQHGPDFGARLALSEIWAILGVKDQTGAMARLRELLAEAPVKDIWAERAAGTWHPGDEA